MTIIDIVQIIDGEMYAGIEKINKKINTAYATDIMDEDVLKYCKDDTILITGLNTGDPILTAEKLGISSIILVRKKEPSEEMKQKARDLGIVIIKSKYTMFKTCGLLFQNGINALF